MRSVLLDVAMVPTLPLVPKILVLVFQFLKSWALAPSPSYRGPLVSLGYSTSSISKTASKRTWGEACVTRVW